MTKREPAGVPTGGQFAATVHGESDTTLDDLESDWRYEVANGDTRRGFADWMAANQEAETFDPELVSTRVGDDTNFEWQLPNGDFHRVDGPAEQWRGGPAGGGDEAWWLYGKRHRVDGPAARVAGGVEAGGSEAWYLGGELHRLDGPAVQQWGGVAHGGTEEYWIDGVEVPADQFESLVTDRKATRSGS